MVKKYIFASVVLLLLLILRSAIFYSGQRPYRDGQKLDFETRLTEEPQIKFGRQQFRVRIGNGEEITIITGLKPQLQYGDRITVSGIVSQQDYKGHIFSSIKNPDLQIDDSEQNFVTGTATGIRRFAKRFYAEFLPPVSASLLTGIVFGGNQGLPDKFMQDLQVSGVVHVIAASGMNVTFVASALIGILGLLFKRQIALTIAIFGILFYALLAGFEPSIIRASIMAIIAFSAKLFGRQNLALTSLFITGFLMLFISPYLISDIGFQLSFLATWGILTIKPLLDGGLGRLGKLGKLGGENLTTTIAAQVATVPILLSVFGNYGLLSIVVNGIVLWTVPVLMFLGGLSLLFGFMFEPFGKLILLLSLPILLFFENTIRYFGDFGWTLTIPYLSGAVWVGYSLLLLAIIFLIPQNRSKNTLKHENTS